MSPAAAIRVHSSLAAAWWRGCVVRTTSSAGAQSGFPSSSNCAAVRSASCCGVRPSRCRRPLHLLAMFIHSGHEQDIRTVKPLEAGDRIGGDALIGMADMGRAIGIGYRGRDVEMRSGHSSICNLEATRKAPASRPPLRSVSGRRSLDRRRQIGEKGQNKRPLVEIEDFGLARRLGQFFPYKA